MDVFATGIVLREISSGSLLADFPLTSLERIDVVTKHIIRIVLQNEVEKIALKFGHEFDYESFLRLLCSNNVPVSIKNKEHVESNAVSIPDANDECVQELLLQLLYSDKFKIFVEDLGELTGHFTQNINSGN